MPRFRGETTNKRDRRELQRERRRNRIERRISRAYEKQQEEMRERDKRVTELAGRYGHNSCGRKIRYATEGEARSHAERCMAKGYPRMSLYKCSLCGGWHLTTHPWRKRGDTQGGS